MSYDNALPLILTFSIGSLFVAWWLARWVLKKETGTAAMQQISNAIKEGAEAFLRRQNGTIALLALLLAVLIFVLYGFVRSHQSFDPVPTAVKMAFWTTLSFVLGAGCSVFAGYVGMWISIRSNIRTASAARSSLNDALRIALRGGAVSEPPVVREASGTAARRGGEREQISRTRGGAIDGGRDGRHREHGNGNRGAPQITRGLRNRAGGRVGPRRVE